MLDSKGDKHNVTLFLSLAIILVVFGQVVGAEIIDHSSSSSTLIISNQNSLRSNGENISGKLSKMRHLLKSLLFDWNSRESEIRGSIARTFGRIRMMRKIIVPLTFIGGFLTAIIIGIKITGVFNVILVTKVLMLQLALILGKLLYGLKDLFASKHHHPQPVYHVSPPVTYYHEPSYIPYESSYSSPHGSSSHGSSYGNHVSSRDDALSPQFNHPINQLPSFIQPQQNFQPQAKYGQPQISPFSRIALQAPQQLQFSPQSFIQPYSRLQTLDQRILSENLIDDNSQLIQAPKTSLSPQELTQVLSDAIAQVSAKSSLILGAIQKR